MDDIDELVKIYESRKHEVEILANSVLTFFQKEPTLKFGQNDSVIHSLKCRIKETSHLRDKLKRKASEANPITKDNFFDRITDLAGVRVLHLYNDQFSIIHQAIMKYASNPQLIGLGAFFACKARNNHFVAHVLVRQKRLRHKSPLPHKAT